MPLDLNTLVQRNPELVAVEVDGEIMMLSVARGKYYALNRTGSRVWQLLEKPCNVSNLIDMLQEEYAVAEEVCRQDVLQLLAEMEQEQVVSICGA